MDVSSAKEKKISLREPKGRIKIIITEDNLQNRKRL